MTSIRDHSCHQRRPVPTAVLLSGSGRTLENLLGQIAARALPLDIRIVVSSKPAVRGLEIAGAAGIPTAVIERKGYASDAAYSAAVYAALAPYAPKLIVMAGFLRRLVISDEWQGRVLNIHPALLPESSAAGKGFYGDRVHAAVLASGDAVSGATVHLVNNDYDQGPPIMRKVAPVLPGDTPATLGARVFAVECELYPSAIQAYIDQHPELFPAS